MSKIKTKALFTVWVCILGLACGQQRAHTRTDDPMVMLRTQRMFTIRSNPCGCIVNRQALDFEVQLGSQWRRVFVEATQSNSHTLKQLKSFFLKHPHAHHQIEARFLEFFYQWLPGHHAPGMVIDSVSIASKSRQTSPGEIEQ